MVTRMRFQHMYKSAPQSGSEELSPVVVATEIPL